MWDLAHVYERVGVKRMLMEWPENATRPTYNNATHVFGIIPIVLTTLGRRLRVTPTCPWSLFRKTWV